MNFLTSFIKNRRKIAEAMNKITQVTPTCFNQRDLRLLKDGLLKHVMPNEFPNLFAKAEESDDCSADLIYLPTNRCISLKSQQRIFPRPFKNGKGETQMKPVAIVNYRQNGDNIWFRFNADWLWLYQPPIPEENQLFTMALLRASKVVKHVYQAGDQWRIKPDLSSFDYYEEFELPVWRIEHTRSNQDFQTTLNKYFARQWKRHEHL